MKGKVLSGMLLLFCSLFLMGSVHSFAVTHSSSDNVSLGSQTNSKPSKNEKDKTTETNSNSINSDSYNSQKNAEQKSKGTKTSRDKTQTISYQNYKDKLDQFTSKVWFSDSFFGFGAKTAYLINSFVQAVFWIAKFTFSIFAGLYDKLTDTDPFSTYITTIISSTATTYKSLKNGIGYLFVGLFAVYAFWIFAFKNGSFVKTMLKFAIVVSLGMLYFHPYKNGYLITSFYNNTKAVTNSIAESAMEDNPLTSSSRSTDVLDSYFKTAVWTPYQNMNSVKDSKNANGFKLTDNQFISLLGYSDGDDDYEVKDGSKSTKISDLAGTEDKVKNKMLKNAWGEKFSYAFVAVLESVFVGLAIGIFAIVSFFMKVLIMLLLTIAPFALIISMMPTFENVLFNLFKRLFSSIVISGMMTFLAALFMYFNNLLTTISTAIAGSNIILGCVIKIIVLVLLWKRRDYLISILTANRVTNTNNRFTKAISRAGSSVSNRAKTGALNKMAVVGAAAGGGYLLAKNKMKAGMMAGGSTAKNQLNHIKKERLRNRIQKADGQYDDQFKEKELKRQNKRINRSKNWNNLKKGIQGMQMGYYNLQSEYYKNKGEVSPQYDKVRKQTERHRNNLETLKTKGVDLKQRQKTSQKRLNIVQNRNRNSQQMDSPFVEVKSFRRQK